jgi:hypothetical protein
LPDAEVVTFCVAQAIMGIASDHRFAPVARPVRPGRHSTLLELTSPKVDERALALRTLARMHRHGPSP